MTPLVKNSLSSEWGKKGTEFSELFASKNILATNFSMLGFLEQDHGSQKVWVVNLLEADSATLLPGLNPKELQIVSKQTIP